MKKRELTFTTRLGFKTFVSELSHFKQSFDATQFPGAMQYIGLEDTETFS